MAKLLQINITANKGSHGRIAEHIGRLAKTKGWESIIAYGRSAGQSESRLYRIGCMADEYCHALSARLLDNQGLMSARTTNHLVHFIEAEHPDLVHLHNIHGYYLNYPLLFSALARLSVPVVWTLHDCWPFTGHCAHYMAVGCEKWKGHCTHCPQQQAYPKSVWLDRSWRNFDLKRRAFLSLDKLTVVPVSRWLASQLPHSFLSDVPVRQIYNGIDTEMFKPLPQAETVREKYGVPSDHYVVLGVASSWYRKGLPEFVRLREKLGSNYTLIVVGPTAKEARTLPKGMLSFARTDSQAELAALYSAADVYFNPTWEDNFPTTNLEAMACGTPVITYNTGGSPESLLPQTGFVVPQGDVDEASKHIRTLCEQTDKAVVSRACRNRILSCFRQEDRFAEYFSLYESLLH